MRSMISGTLVLVSEVRLVSLGLQLTYTNRYNPDGVYRWAASGVDPFVKHLGAEVAAIADPGGQTRSRIINDSV